MTSRENSRDVDFPVLRACDASRRQASNRDAALASSLHILRGEMTMRRLILVGSLLVAVGYADTEASAQSKCADCHFANMKPSFAAHVRDWDLSAHARARVGCDGCHGGNPDTFDSALAHKDIQPSGHPRSPVHWSRLVTTCGTCHVGQALAFARSRHDQLRLEGDARGPSCITCHDAAGERLLSAKGLQSECASCHGAAKRAPRPDLPLAARNFFEGIRDVRRILEQAESLVSSVKDKARRVTLTADVQQARVPLTLAIQAAHSFRYDDSDQLVALARRRATTLVDTLANPPRPSR
jgi:hypothetical protein